MWYNLPPSVTDHYNLFQFAQVSSASFLMHAYLTCLLGLLQYFPKTELKTSPAQECRMKTKMQEKKFLSILLSVYNVEHT